MKEEKEIGVYKLLFKDGGSYIGCSTNVEKRRYQHETAMANGYASGLLQHAFHKYGSPEFKLVKHFTTIYLARKHEAKILEALKPEFNISGTKDPTKNIPAHNTQYLNMKIDADLYLKLKIQAITDGLTLKDFVNGALTKYFQTEAAAS